MGGEVRARARPTRQRDALPALAAIGGVQQDGGLAHDPALVAVEGDGVEAEVEALVLRGGGWVGAAPNSAAGLMGWQAATLPHCGEVSGPLTPATPGPSLQPDCWRLKSWLVQPSLCLCRCRLHAARLPGPATLPSLANRQGAGRAAQHKQACRAAEPGPKLNNAARPQSNGSKPAWAAPTCAACTVRGAQVLPPSKVSSSVCRLPSRKPGGSGGWGHTSARQLSSHRLVFGLPLGNR